MAISNMWCSGTASKIVETLSITSATARTIEGKLACDSCFLYRRCCLVQDATRKVQNAMEPGP